MREFWKTAIWSKGYSPCKGYSVCQMVSLGQELKMPKTCEKRFHQNIRVVLWKNTKYSRNERSLKIGHLRQRVYSPCKGSSVCRRVCLGQKLKMPKTCDKQFHKNHRVVLWKNQLEKTLNIRETRGFWKSAIWGKGYSPCKGYSLCQMVSVSQKLKLPKTCEKQFHKNIRVLPCKKQLEKTPNIREMRGFWKSAIWCKGYSFWHMVCLG